MVNYTLNRGDHDGFQTLHPKSTYQDRFGAIGIVYESEYAYYTQKIFKNIEKRYPKAERYVAKATINGNNNVVEDEVLYIDEFTKTVIAMKLYWDLQDYILDVESIPDDMDIEEDIDENGPKDIRITKRSRFQAKITLYAKFDTPELHKFFQKLVSVDKKPKKRDRQLSIVCFSSTEGLYLKSFTTNKTDTSLEEHYNDDFKECAEMILKRLNTKDDNGIVLFHSDPGCGKTTFLRFLTQKIKQKRIIYLPPDMAHKLADPDFMGFLMNYPNSVLFIEDAENCLQRRDAGGNQAVSNLLNNSDGLLGDALKLQIVCTFNCKLDMVDPALLREGRLIAEYKFEKLSKEKTTALIKKLYGENSDHLYRVEPKTLAEIYNLDKKKFKSEKKTSATIGFNRH